MLYDENAIAKLQELKTLFDEGILTQEEFEREKKKILQSGKLPDRPQPAPGSNRRISPMVIISGACCLLLIIVALIVIPLKKHRVVASTQQVSEHVPVTSPSVSADWVEGIWWNSGDFLLLFPDGSFVEGGEFENQVGTYSVQNGKVVFRLIKDYWDSEAVKPFVKELKINVSADKLGTYKRMPFMTEEEKARREAFELDWTDYTEAEFKRSGAVVIDF